MSSSDVQFDFDGSLPLARRLWKLADDLDHVRTKRSQLADTALSTWKGEHATTFATWECDEGRDLTSCVAALREAVYGASHPFVTRDLRIIRSQMGSSAGLVGAARVASEQLFAPAFLKEWVLQGSPLAHPAFTALHDRLSKTSVPPPPPRARTGQELPK